KDIEELVAKTIAEFGKIDILVNNAAVGPTASFGDPEYLNSYDWVMNVNVRSVQVLTQLALSYLEITKGNIINISSIAGTIPSAARFPYHMSKCALNMFTKCLALGLGPKGVRVNCITLGPIRSHSMDSNAKYKDNEAALERHCEANYPLRRIGEVEDVVEAVAYLASHKSSYITGAILPTPKQLYALNSVCPLAEYTRAPIDCHLEVVDTLAQIEDNVFEKRHVFQIPGGHRWRHK
ncbi:unnamed protein product, partial [Medioppia subpectinata]